MWFALFYFLLFIKKNSFSSKKKKKAEKPSVAKGCAQILSKGSSTKVKK